MTTHYSSSTQPRRTTGRTHPPLPPLSTLPRSSSHYLNSQTTPTNKSHTMAPRGRTHYSTSTAPAYRPSQNGDYTLTKKILSAASQTGSTQDLRVLLQDALALTEKLDSVSASVARPLSTSSSQRLSASSVFLHSPVAKSPRSPRSPVVRSPHTHSHSGGSVFRAQSLGDELDRVGLSPHYETSTFSSSAGAAALATPLRKTPPTTNGHASPPLPSGPISQRRGSPLLNDSRGSSADYASPRPSRQVSQKSVVAPETPKRSVVATETPGSVVATETWKSSEVGSEDDIDVALDCIAQLEALERELKSSMPPDSPQREGRRQEREEAPQREGRKQEREEESHYEVDPLYVPRAKKEKEVPVPPSERVGGGRPTMKDFVDELTEVEQKVSQDPGDAHRARGMTSSTATRELDELMANLSMFEPEPAATGPVGKPEGVEGGREGGKTKSTAMDNLNSMLGSLDEDMTKRHGVNTTTKGVCAACNKPILAKVVNALGRQWHKEHFTCAQCDVELGSATYYESNGRPYCEKDYHELFAPRCAYCNGPILERVLRALDKTWHKEHFFCTLCGKDFGSEGFHEKDGKAFCRECYYEKFAPKCKRCDKAIMEGFITALSSQWHPECFCCKVCGVTFPRGNYFDHEGEPHCEIHYHASRGTLCASCQKPVTGKCITAMGRKWHPEHFTCAFCLKLLNKGTFKEHRHNPYCQPCFIKLFG